MSPENMLQITCISERDGLCGVSGANPFLLAPMLGHEMSSQLSHTAPFSQLWLQLSRSSLAL